MFHWFKMRPCPLATQNDPHLLLSYESTCSVVSGDCVTPGTGTVYVVVGTAGKALDPQGFTPYDW